MLTQYEIFLNPKVNIMGTWGSHQPVRAWDGGTRLQRPNNTISFP